MLLCPACQLVLSVAATNQLANRVVLLASTILVTLRASAATLLSDDLLWTQT